MSRVGNPDVVVVGGGIVGAACGYYLSQAGLAVHLLERASLLSGTSSACEGNLLLWDKELERELPLARRSLDLWRQLASELDLDFEYEPKGSILVAEDEAGLAAGERKARDLAAAGVVGAVLGSRKLRTEEPALAGDIAGGVLFPGDGQVEPRLATLALIRGGRRQGLVVREHTPVRRVERDGTGRVRGVETPDGFIATDAVVIAAGVWSRALAATTGIDLPVYPRKGQIVVTERAPGLIRRKLMEAAYTTTVESGTAGRQVAMVAESTRSGTLLLGSSREMVGLDRTVSPGAVAAITARAIRFFPALAGLQAIRTYAGLRPFSPDHLPLVGPVDGASGLYVATGHEGAGICLAPASGELIARWVTGQPRDFPDPWFDPDRFAGHPSEEVRA